MPRDAESASLDRRTDSECPEHPSKEGSRWRIARRGQLWVVYALLRAAVCLLAAWTAAAQPSEEPEWPRVVIEDVYTRDAARRTLSGAREWLAKPGCQTVFSEFEDERGRRLSERLQELSATPESYLQLVFFFDGEQHPVCKRHGVLAFTEPGSRVIYLCGREFERAARRNPVEARATIVHEVLHSLGLKEDPPTPRFITHRIRQQCS